MILFQICSTIESLEVKNQSYQRVTRYPANLTYALLSVQQSSLGGRISKYYIFGEGFRS